MKTIYFFIICLLSSATTKAQAFISKGQITYESRVALMKTLKQEQEDGDESSWFEEIKSTLPEFKTAYYKLTFANQKGIYKFDSWEIKSEKIPEWWRRNDEEKQYFFDFENNRYAARKSVAGSIYIINDSLPNIQWRLTNETRDIAGFTCKKAIGKILDSIYVFAFYTDDIVFSGGPNGIGGLPGAIMGLTIPRLYVSYVATGVTVNNINEASITNITNKKPYTQKSMIAEIDANTKDWFSWGDDKEKNRKQRERFLWNMLL
jgi:GLPGLI family protein